MDISIKSNIKQLTKSISGFADQIPFVTSVALNNTAFDARQGVQGQILRDVDKPTRFTINAPRFKRSNKRNLTAVVFIPDKQWQYLERLINGGVKHPKGTALAISQHAKKNQYGNIPRGAIGRALARQDTFSGTVRGTPGIWQRVGKGKLKLLYVYSKSATYKGGSFDYLKSVQRVVDLKFNEHFTKAFKQAIKTARL